MGKRGPVPNRSEDLARERTEADNRRAGTLDVRKGTLRPTKAPKPDPDWHPIATMLYTSLGRSGQSDWYQDSDWAYAYMVCDELSVYKSSEKTNGQVLATIYSAMSSLLVTEGDRRRVAIELESPPKNEKKASDFAMERYRNGLGLVKSS